MIRCRFARLERFSSRFAGDAKWSAAANGNPAAITDLTDAQGTGMLRPGGVAMVFIPQTFRPRFPAVFVCLLLMASPAVTREAGPPAPGWKAKILASRASKDKEFKQSSSSPMAAVQRLTATPANPLYLTLGADGVQSSRKPGGQDRLRIVSDSGTWIAEPLTKTDPPEWKGRALLTRQPIKERIPLKLGRFTIMLNPGPEELVATIYDPRRPELLAFHSLLYFDPDPAFAVTARVEVFPEAKPVKMLTSRNLEKTMYRYGQLHFTLQGRQLALTVFKPALQGPDAGYFFIPFKDLTNGTLTYTNGRFIECPAPATAEMLLDFNLAFNPLCNYSPGFNCPLPPAGNHLPVAIRAGEKVYPSH